MAIDIDSLRTGEGADSPFFNEDMFLPSRTNNYYRRLEIDNFANPEEVRKAYHKAAKRWHSDGKPRADKGSYDREFRYVSEAYRNLSNPASKYEYDSGLTQRLLRSMVTEAEEHRRDACVILNAGAGLIASGGIYNALIFMADSGMESNFLDYGLAAGSALFGLKAMQEGYREFKRARDKADSVEKLKKQRKIAPHYARVRYSVLQDSVIGMGSRISSLVRAYTKT